MSDIPVNLGDENERLRLWAYLCSIPLAGRARLTKNGLCFAQSVLSLYHPSQPAPFHEVFLGTVPGVSEGDLVGFNLDPAWEPADDRRCPTALRGSPRKVDEATFSSIEDSAATWFASAVGSYPERLQELIELQANVSETQTTNATYALELSGSWKELTEEREEFEQERSRFEELGGSRVVRLLDALDGTQPEGVESVQHAPPDSLVDAVSAEFKRTGHELSEREIERLLVAHFLSIATGFLVVFGGPPGAGKSTVARLLPQVLGESCTITAVRPGWLDATDLLGYFNPDRQEFQPTPVLSFIYQAGRDRPHLPSVLTLDELNLARIENYAADLLSELEYSRRPSGGKLHLYGTRRAASEQLLADLAAGASLSEIEESLAGGTIPPTLPIPLGLCVQGTLNEDATTHELSPKVRDRCLAIRVEHAPVRLFREAGPEVESVCTAACSWLPNPPWISEDQVARTVQDRWEAALELSAEAGAPPLSHRTARCFEHVPALSELLELTPERVAEWVLVLRLMVWMEFSRRDAGADHLAAYADRAEALGFAMLAQEVRTLLERDGEYVKYLF